MENRKRRHLTPPASALAGLLAVALVGCAPAGPGQDPAGPPAASATSTTSMAGPGGLSLPREMGHVHALRVNPANGDLYAATHHGLYRFAGDADPQLVGELVQDFMGFTVVGPDHFLASGHPGAGHHGQPANLGLIESTDGGQTWVPLSLSGRADFHSLEHRHGRTYGLDSQTGRVLISDDNRTWQQRAGVRALDLAVSPADPDELLITTAAGLQRSDDAGATYQPVSGSPALAYLSWPTTGPLIGVDRAGTLYASEDAGATWQARHLLEQQPQALLAVGDGRVFTVAGTGGGAVLYESADDAVSVTRFGAGG
ncbi:F510_1955 family glycosylhydrolase [Mycolicibacterium palauense]|uniref:F510_1955 family glycosylhydrolase n=1 Tax=Mycolicibacterium palauense TaxID=2034511 RepID=UPI000BFEDDC9|nr:sialidase family protein [Mycolicibacterium palauense]